MVGRVCRWEHPFGFGKSRHCLAAVLKAKELAMLLLQQISARREAVDRWAEDLHLRRVCRHLHNHHCGAEDRKAWERTGAGDHRMSGRRPNTRVQRTRLRAPL